MLNNLRSHGRGNLTPGVGARVGWYRYLNITKTEGHITAPLEPKPFPNVL